jgi:hypothetical protein
MMKLVSLLAKFLRLFIKQIKAKHHILHTRMDFLNASEIQYIYNTEDPETGFLYMHINFTNQHKLCIQFNTREEYQQAIKELTASEH